MNYSSDILYITFFPCQQSVQELHLNQKFEVHEHYQSLERSPLAHRIKISM